MIQLPKERSGKTAKNPRRLIIFSQTKAGKTRCLAGLQNALFVDTEEGARYVDVLKIDLKEECRKHSINPLVAITQIGDSLDAYYKENNKYPYDYLIIDTITEIEEFARKYATHLYRESPTGKNFQGKDVVAELPQGGGYMWLREAFDRLLAPLDGKCNICTIFVGHVRTASITKDGKELSAKDLALTGKIKLKTCADADAIGYLYRNPKNNNQTILSFKNHEQDLATGARSEHLANRDFVICELIDQENNVFKTNWDQIFIDE